MESPGMYKKRHTSTQTEVDALYEQAEAIVKNFNLIENYWKRVEQINHLLLGCALGIGVIFMFQRL